MAAQGEMMDETKTFSLRTVLTVTTDRLLTKPKGDRDNGIGDVYELVNWMLMDSIFTHQLGRAFDECSPHLFRLFPELGLASACLSKLDCWIEKSQDGPETGIRMWVAELQMLFPEIKKEYAVPQFPLDHIVKDPIEELTEIAPDVPVIPVNAPVQEVWPDHIEA